MKENDLTCSMCGHRFDPTAHATCQACPLKKGCQLVCCPACGFETVDPQKSILAGLAIRIFSKSSIQESAPTRPNQNRSIPK